LRLKSWQRFLTRSLIQPITQDNAMTPRSTINATFRLVFLTVTGITVFSGITCLGLAAQQNLTPQQLRVFETAQVTWQTGTGALLGLLGGKAGALFESNQEDED
jgi:hypothetical protein